MRVGQGALAATLGALLLIGCGVRLTHFKGETRRQVISSSDPVQQPLAAYMGAARPRPDERTQAEHTMPPASVAGLEPGCLITKWGGVWLLDARQQRWHVESAGEACELRAAIVESDDLSPYPKAFGGGPGYALSATASKAACLQPACQGPGLTPPAAVAGAGGGGAGAGVAVAGMAPSKGWGMGPGDGWMEQSPLRFNQIAKEAFSPGGAYHSLPPGQPLLLVFGGASVNDMLRNWALHVQKIQLPFVVTCMDESLFTLAGQHALPAAIFQTGHEAAGPGVVTTRWMYFRMDPRAFMTMGILKVRFFLAFVRAGFDILCADLDVLWLRDPRPWVTGQVNTSLLIAYADIVVSTDVTSDAAENDRASWGLHQELNTGMLMLRSSPGAAVVCEAWVSRMQQEMVSIEKLPKNMLQWWSNDQTFFNEVIQRSRILPDLDAKLASDPSRRRNAFAHLRSIDRRPARVAGLNSALHAIETLAAHPRASAADLAALRGLQFRQRSGVAFAIGTFPYELFASGHTFFTQSLQARRGFSPVAVHTTFQFCDTAEFAWGKRSRLRERLMWLVDPDTYYERVGPASEPKPEPTELGYAGFLHLDGALLDFSSWPQPYVRTEASGMVKIEGSPSFIAAVRERRGDVLSMHDGPAKHLIIEAFQRRLVHNAMALARAMKRKLVLPPLQCWSDRYWNMLEGGRFPGVRADAQPLPFHCPFDHLFDNEKWAHSDAPIREYSFLDNSRIKASDRNDSVRLVVRGAPAEQPDHTGRAPAPTRRSVELAPGDDYGKAAEEIRARGWEGAFVVHIGARSLELLCESIGSSDANQQFNAVMHRVLGIGEQIRFCDAADNRWYNGRQDDHAVPINCTWGFHRPPLLPVGGGLLGLGDRALPACEREPAAILAARMAEPDRSWSSSLGGRNLWSTPDRAGALYHQYM